MGRLWKPLICLVLLPSTAAKAHVGSPDVFFEGTAGPYRLFVTVRLPVVIPGVAEIEIRSESSDLREVHIVPLRLTGPGSNLPPTPDLARRSQADPQFFTGSLWLMEGGSLQVRILADGARGKGTVSVPVPSVAQRVLSMQKPLGALLFGLMLLLAAGAVSIASAAGRDSGLNAGQRPTPADSRRGRLAAAVAAGIVLCMVYLGGRWWRSEASFYEDNVYKPPRVNASVQPGDRLFLRAEGSRIPTGFRARSAKSKLDDLIPDHGHLMHLFLIRVPQLDRFWHLHPQQLEPAVFVQDLPAVAAGHYRIFADIVHSSGFPETLVGEVDLPNLAGKALGGDDSGWAGAPVSQVAPDSTVAALPGGGRLVWQRGGSTQGRPLTVNTPMSFRFLVEDKIGHPAADLEPYMGMPGHAEFMRVDGSVFAHVHPAGSVSMAALEIAQTRSGSLFDGGGSNSPGREHANMIMPHALLPAELSFPYGFPKPGLYRIFVQIKRAGRIGTGVFDASVAATSSN